MKMSAGPVRRWRCIWRAPPAGAVRRRDEALMRTHAAKPLDIWAAGVGLGLRTLWREPTLGLKRLALPVSYWRAAEFAYVWQHLTEPPGGRILDLGSPK